VIVYVETNFILELALFQEQSGSVEEMLRRAARGEDHLRFSTLAVAEAISKLGRRPVERGEFLQRLQAESHQLQRSRPLQALAKSITDVAKEIGALARVESDQLEAVLMTIFRVGQVIEMDRSVLDLARAYTRDYDLSLTDAIVHASTISDLSVTPRDPPKLFTSRDARAFTTPSLQDELATYGCDCILNFDHALARLKHVGGESRP
jgi:predicted nucleic acid-binding protein